MLNIHYILKIIFYLKELLSQECVHIYNKMQIFYKRKGFHLKIFVEIWNMIVGDSLTLYIFTGL